MLLAASAHHWYNVPWADWITVIGLPLTLLGLLLTYRQAKAAVKATQAAQRATRRTEQLIRAKQLMILVPQLSQTVRELDSAITANDSAQARRDLDRWRWQATSVHGILSATDSSEKKLLKTVQDSVGLAETANGALFDSKAAVYSGCAQAHEAMIVACDRLNAWIGKYSTQAWPYESEEI